MEGNSVNFNLCIVFLPRLFCQPINSRLCFVFKSFYVASAFNKKKKNINLILHIFTFYPKYYSTYFFDVKKIVKCIKRIAQNKCNIKKQAEQESVTIIYCTQE